MGEYESRPEISKADLAALDLVIAEMEERGIEDFPFEPEEFLLTVTPLVRTITTITTQTIMQNEYPIGPLWEKILREEAAEQIRERNVTLKNLIEVRDRLGGNR